MFSPTNVFHKLVGGGKNSPLRSPDPPTTADLSFTFDDTNTNKNVPASRDPPTTERAATAMPKNEPSTQPSTMTEPKNEQPSTVQLLQDPPKMKERRAKKERSHPTTTPTTTTTLLGWVL